jgi:hypothetical protein
METNYKITIPKPCHEDWDKMTPDHTGRFCNSCVKSVVDFTNMKTPEIHEYFIRNQGQSVCGRFKSAQLDTIIIQIPRDILFSQAQFHKVFMLALLVSMGTTLFSCQNPNGDKQNIDKVEVVDSTACSPTMGVLLPSADSIKKDTLSNTKTIAPLPIEKTGEIVLSGLASTQPLKPVTPVIDKNFIYQASTVEVLPIFPGGIAKFYEYFKSSFNVPEANKATGKIIASFVVDSDGSLIDVHIIRGVNEIADREAARVLMSSPKWIPGEQHGEKVKVAYSLPIKINPN